MALMLMEMRVAQAALRTGAAHEFDRPVQPSEDRSTRALVAHPKSRSFRSCV
jgi:hypothetical protein